MSEADSWEVVLASGDVVHFEMDSGFLSFGIYNADGEPVSDVVLSDIEATQITERLQEAARRLWE